ncbi:hypothetical protein [Phaffia rhodozyma]|uniref:Wax synthase domain-containing protein n=1 Tax=Phaffia rhodozyma TaxID=264483 RepID=A0A0F7SI08_PHARH|nr:hypothetical protein [Phaffia rhodozyma]
MFAPLVILSASDRPAWTALSLPLCVLLPPFILFIQSSLLFSPSASSPSLAYLRRALVPLAILGILPLGFSHHFSGIQQFSDLNNLWALYALVLSGKSIELGFRSETPKWIGWVGDEVKGQTIKKEEKVQRDQNVARWVLAWRYVVSFRNIGFSTGLSPSFYAPHPAPIPRFQAIVRELKIILQCYLFLDFILLPYTFHPKFGSLELSHEGSLYAPFGNWPVWATSYGLALISGLSLHVVQTFMYHILAVHGILLAKSPVESLYWPSLFQVPEAATSLSSLWGRRWHQLFRASLGFCGFEFAKKLGAPRAFALMFTFFLSALLHYLAVEAQGRPASTHGPTWPLPLFFIMQGVGIIMEGLFEKLTKRKVRGIGGRIWTWGWMLFWGRGAMEVYVRRGQPESMSQGSLGAGRPFKWALKELSRRNGWGLYD